MTEQLTVHACRCGAVGFEDIEHLDGECEPATVKHPDPFCRCPLCECGAPHKVTEPRIVAECWNCGGYTDKHPAGLVNKPWWTRKPLTAEQVAGCRAAGHDVRPVAEKP